MTKWIKSKVVVFFGIGNQFAGMFTVDSQEQIDMLQKLMYEFPIYYKVYDEIPRIEEAIQSIHTHYQHKTVKTTLKDIDGVVKTDVLDTHMKGEEFLNFCKKIEEIFGSS